MRSALAIAVCVAFTALSLWHLHMALKGRGSSFAVPSLDGKPLFVPSRAATLGVAVILTLFAALVAATARLVPVGVSPAVLSWMSYILALGLLLRAVGDFRYVGFFKRVRGSKFATLDTFMYAPLCVLLAAGVALVALQHGT